jgi:hypothetical protein
LGETTNLVFEEELLIEFDNVLGEQTEITKAMMADPNSELIERKLHDWYSKITGLHLFI